MKLFEFKKLPEVFGKAKIEYTEGIIAPRRNGNVITIPYDGYVDLFPLDGLQRSQQKQFILTRGDNYWFGGTDENPFLVRLSTEPIKAFLEGGVLREARFYARLRWKEVGDMERATKRNCRRQGDIFAVPLNIGWVELTHCFRVASTPLSVVDTNETAIFGTRHILKGKIATGNPVKVYEVGTRVIASGVIAAPDHTDLDLGDKPHALYQTANLYEPEKAD